MLYFGTVRHLKPVQIYGRAWIQDKRQKACVPAFVEAVRIAGSAPIPVHELIEVSQIAIEGGN